MAPGYKQEPLFTNRVVTTGAYNKNILMIQPFHVLRPIPPDVFGCYYQPLQRFYIYRHPVPR